MLTFLIGLAWFLAGLALYQGFVHLWRSYRAGQQMIVANREKRLRELGLTEKQYQPEMET